MNMNKNFNFKKIDAFAHKNSDGNPAGVVYLDSFADITHEEMQRIAQHLSGFVSEVSYVVKRDENTVELRFFSAQREVEFCGHASVAIIYDLLKQDHKLLAEPTINIKTAQHTLVAQNCIDAENAVYIEAPEPVFTPSNLHMKDVAETLNLDQEQIDHRHPISLVNAGVNTLIVPIRTLASVLGIVPNEVKLKKFCRAHDIDIISVFCSTTAKLNSSYRTRVFTPTFGYLEHPATGSGNAALGHYLLKHNRWDGSPINIEQNASFKKPNIIKLSASQANNTFQVKFGGAAITRLSGNYALSA